MHRCGADVLARELLHEPVGVIDVAREDDRLTVPVTVVHVVLDDLLRASVRARQLERLVGLNSPLPWSVRLGDHFTFVETRSGTHFASTPSDSSAS